MENLISGEINVRRENSNHPLDLSFTPTINPPSPPRKSRFIMPALYLVLGLFLFSLFRSIIDVYVTHLKVETGVVSVPIESIVAPASGIISDIFVIPGQTVKKGTPLLRINNFNLERDLQLARLQVEESKINVLYLQHLLANEQERLHLYKDIGSSRVISAQAAVNEVKHELSSNEKQLSRLRLLHRRHYVSETELDRALTKYQSAKEKMKSAIAKKTLENDALNAVKKGIYFTGSKLEGIVADISAQIEDAQNKLKLNQDRVKVYENIISKLTVLAPFDGKVNQILKTGGTPADSVKPILFLEPVQAPKQIVVYLTQNEISHIGLKKEVKVYLPSLGQTYHGKVIDINRTMGFIDEVKAQYRWRDFQVDRSATATIEINAKQKFQSEALSGMPAIVYFPKKYIFL